jgi:hypothetical protein
MTSRTLGLQRLTAAACATLITAVSAWAIWNSTAASERDPFQFAAIMSANARVLIRAARELRHIVLPEDVRDARPKALGVALVCDSPS